MTIVSFESVVGVPVGLITFFVFNFYSRWWTFLSEVVFKCDEKQKRSKLKKGNEKIAQSKLNGTESIVSKKNTKLRHF